MMSNLLETYSAVIEIRAMRIYELLTGYGVDDSAWTKSIQEISAFEWTFQRAVKLIFWSVIRDQSLDT